MMDIEKLQDKSYAFAMRIVLFHREFCEGESRKSSFIKQLLRSGTNIGKYVEEAIGAHSDKELLSRLNSAYKEARKTVYWLKLLLSGDFITQEQAYDFIEDAEEIISILEENKSATTIRYY